MGTIEGLTAWTALQMGIQPESLDRTVIQHYHSEQKKKLLETVANRSPFYRTFIQGEVPWEEIPFTDGGDLRAHSPRMLCVSPKEITRVVTLETSGTTGEPKRIFNTSEDQRKTIDYFRVGMGTFIEAGAKVGIFLPGGKPGSIGTLLDESIRQLNGQGLQLGMIQNLNESWKSVCRESLTVLVGSAVQLLALARYSKTVKIGISPTIQQVLISTDYVPKAIVDELMNIWGCQVIQYYGMTETGFCGGISCSAEDGYHLFESELYIEIIDPETEKPLEDGEIGEVVISTFHREGMPLLRYRTGDLSRIIPKSCSCGSPIRRLGPIFGRVHGGIPVKRGRIPMGALDEILFRLPELLNYHPRYSTVEDTNTLELDCEFLFKAPTEETLKAHLMKNSLFDQLEESEGVQVLIMGQKFDETYRPYDRKRGILIK